MIPTRGTKSVRVLTPPPRTLIDNTSYSNIWKKGLSQSYRLMRYNTHATTRGSQDDKLGGRYHHPQIEELT